MSKTFKHAVIVCHPEKKSFTLSVAQRYAETVRGDGHEVVVRDLYRERFNPVLKAAERRGKSAPDVVREWGHLGKIDIYVLVYPIWFGTPPAMLKGYIDRVFGAGRTRGQGGEGGPREMLAGRRLVSLTSSGSLRAWLDEKGVLMSLHNVYDRYLAEVFGFTETHRYHFDGITENLPERDAIMHLHNVEKAARDVLARTRSGPPDRNPNAAR
jgi:NAD(P)H dehydrogenase (quinone)